MGGPGFQSHRKLGRPVQVLHFEDSPHCQHFRYNREQYVAALAEFLQEVVSFNPAKLLHLAVSAFADRSDSAMLSLHKVHAPFSLVSSQLSNFSWEKLRVCLYQLLTNLRHFQAGPSESSMCENPPKEPRPCHGRNRGETGGEIKGKSR